MRMGRFSESTAAYELELAVAERSSDPRSIAHSLISLAYNCPGTDEHDKGLLYLRRAESLCTPDDIHDPEELSALKNRLLHARGEIFEDRPITLPAAIACYLSVLENEVGLYGRCSHDVAATLVSIANTHNKLGQTMEAAPFVDAAISTSESLGATDSLVFSEALAVHGACLAAQGALEPSLLQLNRALAIQRQRLPPTHPSIASTTRNFSAVLSFLGRDAEAQSSRSAAAAIERRSQIDCAGPGYSKKLREDGAPLDVCVKCRCTFYCGKACQTADWKREGATRRYLARAHAYGARVDYGALIMIVR